MDSATIARMIENGEIDEDKVLFQSTQDFELPAGSSISDVIKEANLVTPRLAVLRKAHFRFSTLSKITYNSSMDFERYYRELYDDIQKHRDVWFDKLYNVDNPDPTHVEFSVGILGTLCTILRQRGDLKACSEVMVTYMAVLKRYQKMTEGCNSQAQIDCCEQLTYKANIIRINLGGQLFDKDMAGSAFREAVAFEKKEKKLGRYDLDGQDPDMDGIFEQFIGHNRYEEVTDDEILKILVYMNKMMSGSDDEPQLKLRVCGCCDKKETMHGDFKKCSRCHEQPYCSKKCQESSRLYCFIMCYGVFNMKCW